MLETLFPKLTDLRFEQFLKAEYSILVTSLPIVTDSNETQPWKAYSLIEVIPSHIVTFLNFAQPLKHQDGMLPSPIMVILSNSDLLMLFN